MRRRLVFSAQKVTEFANGLPRNVETQVVDLHSRITKIYTYVNMDVRILLTASAFDGLSHHLLVV
jgi:hypothetical protein